jgi:hypothetical protein
VARRKKIINKPSTETCEGCRRFQEYGECPIGLPKLQAGQRCFHFVPGKSVLLVDILGKDEEPVG